MSADLSALVASPHFRWLPGMRTKGHSVCVGLDYDSGRPLFVSMCGNYSDGRKLTTHYLAAGFGVPDFDHEGTRGCLLSLVREAWGDPKSYVVPMTDGSGRWKVIVRLRGRETREGITGGTEAEALTAALLAAPPRTEVEL